MIGIVEAVTSRFSLCELSILFSFELFMMLTHVLEVPVERAEVAVIIFAASTNCADSCGRVVTAYEMIHRGMTVVIWERSEGLFSQLSFCSLRSKFEQVAG